MELRQLKYFLKAKELLNFTEAAAQMNISQSTLSQQIKQLEEELRQPLFNRIGKRIILTEAGSLFAGFAQQSVKKANDGLQLLNDLNDLSDGKISIGVTYALRNVLAQAVISFSQQYPKIKFQIVFGTSRELIEKLNRFELDFVLTFEDNGEGGHFNYKKLFTSPMTLVTAADSDLKSKVSITLEEIVKLSLALPSSGYNTTQFINEAFSKKNLKPVIGIEINDIPTLLEIVKTGRWHTILTQTTVKKEPGLSAIPIEGKDMIRTAVIISIKEAYEKKSVTTFLEMLKQTGIYNL
ncbi:LysR family transcriptional regulator [Flavobacterium fluviale]|uniref:LysR family transcriptional regulator n=1 Tax=Flavobacterium fluviale TaxID=2249356 RepID=A0A344LTU5_9FLAO|nr:LysR family transcriptional regulator [Flavobacterium fluviale]AXB57337.1 LysR family transcriptional regulator [Flavobacterium fluviale]